MRRVLIVVVVLAAVLAGLDALLWRWEEGLLADGWRNWVATSRAHGWTVSAGTPVGGGWPLSASLVVPELYVSGETGDLPGGLTWSTDRIVLSVALLHPRALSIASEGMQRVQAGALPDIPYTADRLQAVIPLDPGVPARSVVVRAVNLRAGLPAGAVTLAAMDLRASWTPAAQQNEAAVTVGLTASDIGLPPGPAWPMGSRVDTVALDGSLGGPLPRVPGLAAKLTAWRDGGGTVEVKRLAVSWGKLAATVAATVALDETLQPMGTGTARIQGAAAGLDALAANRAIGEKSAVAAKALLALMTHPGEDGVPEVDVPITVQDRRLSLGRIPLARLPELSWEP